MKEVKIWDNKPRWMWCWDGLYGTPIRKYVVYILTNEQMKECNAEFPVKCGDGTGYCYCAEIEEETKEETHLTNYELSQLLKCFGVERYTINSDVKVACNDWCYEECESMEHIRIRYKQGEWEEPTRETVLKWWEDETVSSDIANFVSFIGWDKE